MSVETKISFLDQLKSAIGRFEQVQRQYRSFGAQDTEPNAVFSSIMRKAAKGKPVDIPTTGKDWDLYASTMDCSEAASALFQAAQAAVDVVHSCPIGQSAEVQEHIKGWYDW